jgi:hypothetical protein
MRHAAKTDAQPNMIWLVLPLHIQSEANSRQHWRAKACRVRTHRQVTAMSLAAMQGRPPAPPLTITMTRVAPRRLDDDNLASGFKAVRDGIADWLEVDDGDRRLTWQYAQRKGKPLEYAAEIEVVTIHT